ncbi:hypothetical protein PNIG_a2049 [Pseudoalteromonas nigrifaciens]|uniref:Uncharacterized protein n=2 Tax=Pseudoalteromonas nigrifaciens TaxID=28109 RepID=A0AAC9XXG7_9GAMM|nr:hypothetical protein [Pseudoalteromonas nigrifaciens]ASM54110.1 hypothetical protein PNIG_a2049 [Pseudoalteromonas nigrifaciens]
MTNINTGEVEFYTVVVKRKGKAPSYCKDSNGMLKFNTLNAAKDEALRLTKEYK